MYERIERKRFSSKGEYKEAFTQWLIDRSWSLDYRWDGENHAACSRVPGGKWSLQSYGFYQAADGLYRLYASHRCTKCGMMVQHQQRCDENGNGVGLIGRMVIIP